MSGKDRKFGQEIWTGNFRKCFKGQQWLSDVTIRKHTPEKEIFWQIQVCISLPSALMTGFPETHPGPGIAVKPVRFWPAPPGEDGAYIYFTGQFAAVMNWHRR